MSFKVFLFNFCLAVFLYFANGYLGKLKSNSKGLFNYVSFSFGAVDNANFSEHFFQKIVHPAVFLALVAVILQSFSYTSVARDLWLIVPFFWVFRLFHIIIWNLSGFTNWRYEVTSMIISMLVGEGTLFFIIRPLIDAGESIFIDQTELRDAFWIAVISYLIKLFWDIAKATLSGYSVFPVEKRSQTILKRYDKFKWFYGVFINEELKEYSFDDNLKKEHFICLLYSVMIYEDHCRPTFVRTIEYIIKFLKPNATMSLGIMQVQTDTLISNRTSIRLAIKKLYDSFAMADKRDWIYRAAMNYNPSHAYYMEIYTIYNCLSSRLGLPAIDFK